MSSIASPRPSVTLSSRRTSISTDASTRTPQSTDKGSLRRNRAALRDYYNIKPAGQPNTQDPQKEPDITVDGASEVDRPDFDAETYVQSLLATKGIEDILRTGVGIVSEIRSLDGEKKALVYDNYSKLIAATDTIRSMREKMDPLTPTTSELAPAIAHIAETASQLSAGLGKHRDSSAGQPAERQKVSRKQRQQQRETVRWVLDSPERLKNLVEDDRRTEAEDEWKEVERLLDLWDGVEGTDDVRARCNEVMQQDGK